MPRNAPGVRIIPSWDHLGLRASGSHELVLDNVALPLENAVDLRAPTDWAPAAGSSTEAQSHKEQQALMAVLLGTLYDAVARAAHAWLAGFLHGRAPPAWAIPWPAYPGCKSMWEKWLHCCTPTASCWNTAAQRATEVHRHQQCHSGGRHRAATQRQPWTIAPQPAGEPLTQRAMWAGAQATKRLLPYRRWQSRASHIRPLPVCFLSSTFMKHSLIPPLAFSTRSRSRRRLLRQGLAHHHGACRRQQQTRA